MSMRATVLLVLLWECVCHVQVCECFPNGSVLASCGNMAPVHPPFSPAPTSPPARISTSSTSYRPGGVITVMLEVKNGSAPFQGFLLQARSREGEAVHRPVGKFTNIDTRVFTPLHCSHLENSSVSQAAGVNRTKIRLTWEAPSDSRHGDIYFSATLVQDYTTFWVHLNSSAVTLDRSGNSASRVSPGSALVLISVMALTAY